MAKLTGFMEYRRQLQPERSPVERVQDWLEFHQEQDDASLRRQGARCMDCGIPYCSSGIVMNQGPSGCPVNNLIPEWNELVYRGLWREALLRLQKTNNFPEFTGRICPAPCESACTVGLIGQPVTIKELERAIVDRGFDEGWITATVPEIRTGKRVAVIGSGPAGLACADQLNRVGHEVTVFERDRQPGGLLMYGIPAMKLEKAVVKRRLALLADSGVIFVTNTEVGEDYPIDRLQADFDAIVLCIGATRPKELAIAGRSLRGIHFALDYLHANVQSLLDSNHTDGQFISAAGKDVLIIGGGDTGTDCLATALRHDCKSVTQFGIHDKLPTTRAASNPWPQFSYVSQLDYGQAEAYALHGRDPRQFCIKTTRFIGNEDGAVTAVETVQLEWVRDETGREVPVEIAGTKRTWPAQLVLLAMGYRGSEEGVLEQLGVERDEKLNAKAPYGRFMTKVPGVFAAGDVRRGQSLVVWAIHEGRAAARECDRFLMGYTNLP